MTSLYDDSKHDSASGAGNDELTPGEQEAAALDNGDLEGHYEQDEKEIARYQGLHYSAERREWLARFVPARPETTTDPTPDDATYQQVLHRGRLLHACRVKPSQSFKALRAFSARLDREVQKMKFDS